ncbi:ParB N-terminal domain-containing protein [Cypionkella psychrotolerans]|uniref:ParB N-terminal domain-containing protein n=1 Tax=Cypionkella psychrotolerans TaxID=1678131 RepID=UPI0006B62EC1|nr:ParB N-terminal domain-containing protein [Cypionkella psychrotolerans]
MNDTTKLNAPAIDHPETPLLSAKPAVIRLTLDSLTYDPAFTPRLGTAKNHVHDLARAHRNCGDLDPIKVWAEPGTGKLIILDGRHRVAAYRFNRVSIIPAVIFRGDRKDARLEAAKDNAKTTFPWTTAECTQYAWGLVIEGGVSKRQIVQAATVSTGTVTNMRKRLADMVAARATPCGNWWRDRSDNQPDGQPENVSDAVKQARIKFLMKAQQEIEMQFKAKYGQRPALTELGESWRWSLGQARFKAAVSGGCLCDEDEFSDNSELPSLAHPQEQPADITSGDF